MNPAAEEVCDDHIDNDCYDAWDQCDLWGVMSLSDADAVMWGEEPNDHIGYEVVLTADFDGDGFDDIVAGTSCSQTRTMCTAYVFYGPLTGDVFEADARLEVYTEGEYWSWSLAADDVNHDGQADLVLGLPYEDSVELDTGAVYVFFGDLIGQLELSDANVRLLGEYPCQYVGKSVSLGDFTGDDGITDVAVGVPSGYCQGNPDLYSFGQVSIVPGPLYGPQTTQLSTAATVTITGSEQWSYVGTDVYNLGHLSGNDSQDLIVPLNCGARNPCPAYIFSGPLIGDYTVAQADVVLTSTELANTSCGFCNIAEPGDVNGDGYDDFMVADEADDTNGSYAGAAYFFYGPLAAETDLATADAIVIGAAAGDYLGRFMSMAGDVNGTGYDDLVISAIGNDTADPNAGIVYLFYGGVGPVYPYIDLSLGIPSEAAFTGEVVYDQNSLAAGTIAGDINGDGYDDVVISDFYGGDYAEGKIYVIYGTGE